MTYFSNWYASPGLDSSVVIKDDPDRKVYRVKDLLHSRRDSQYTLVTLTKNGKEFNININKLVLVPTDKQMELILSDKKRMLKQLKAIEKLELNYQLRQPKEKHKQVNTET